MTQPNISEGLKELWRSLHAIKATLEWWNLAESEKKPGQPPAFDLNRHLDDDLRHEYGRFVRTALDIGEILNSRDIKVEEKQRQRWRDRLHRLETECRKLNVAEKLKNR